MSRKGNRTNKKFLIIAIILGAILIASLIASIGIDIKPRTKDIKSKNENEVARTYVIKSNYIKEFQLPNKSGAPVAIKVKDGKVWFANNNERKIVKFDPISESFEEFKIPLDSNNNIISIWSIEFDTNGNLWFQDASTNSIWRLFVNEGRFEQYIIPSTNLTLGTSYPINLAIINDKIYFAEIFGKKIGILDPNSVKDKSSNGIKEIEISTNLETIGPLAVDNDNNVWFTALTYPIKGELYKLDINTLSLTRYDLPKDINSPVGIAIDKYNRLWISDHGTSAIFVFNTLDNTTYNIVTSKPIKETSPYLYNECLKTNKQELCGGIRASLPYWNIIVDNKLIFNEHYGNTIGVLDIDNLTLIEYIVPTMNSSFAKCDNYEPCGIANVLRFDVEKDKVWFTEWSEGKIGVLDMSKEVPISLDTDDNITIIRGINKEINIDVRSNIKQKVELRVSSTTSPFGDLVNMTAQFSNNIIDVDNINSVTLNILADPLLESNDYMLTVTAKTDDVMYSKIINVKVI